LNSFHHIKQVYQKPSKNRGFSKDTGYDNLLKNQSNMVMFHQKFIELLKTGESITNIESRLKGFLNIFKGQINKKYFTKPELDTAIKEVIQAMEIWELKNPEQVMEWNKSEYNFDTIKADYEALLEIEWSQKRRTAA